MKATVEDAKAFLEKDAEATDSEANGGDSEGHSESVAVGGRRKRRQTATPAAETPISRRYNLRRHKNAGLAVPSDSIAAKKDVKETDIRRTAASNTKDHEEDAAADGDIACTQVTTIRSEVQEVSSGNAARFARITSVTGESDDPAEVAEIEETVEGAVSGALPTNYEVDQNVSVTHDDLSYEDEDNEEDDQPGETSVGEKLWNFSTT